MSRAELTRRVGGLRRRMPWHLLPAIFLLLVLLCRAWGPAFAVDDAPEDTVTLFATGKTKVPAKVGSEKLTRDVSSFASPFLVGGNGVMVAFVEAWFSENDEESVDIVAKYIDTEGSDWASKATEKNGGNWKTQLALQRKDGDSFLSNPTAVIKGNKIYLLALVNWRNKSSQSGNGWHFEFAVGVITGDVGSKKIEWESSESLHSKLTQEINRKHLKDFWGYRNFGFLRSNGMIVFSVSATNKEGKWGHAILQLNDNEEQWEVSFVENPEGRFITSLFEWKKKLISVFSRFPTDTNYVKEYVEVNEEWKDAEDTLLHMWSSPYALRGFTPVTVGNKTALIFTEESMSTDDGTSEMPLYFTDGNRIKDSVWPNKALYDDFTSGGLVYTNGELFVMYRDISKGLVAFVLTRLDDELENIKFTLNCWAENDAYLSKPCSETAPEGASPDTLCVTPMPTDGLVGFLSKFSYHSEWHDECHYTAAFVNGTKVKNGFTFRRAAAGAQWRINGGTASVWHNFTKYGMTVVATVTVHETPKGDAPLLTVDGVGSYERFGLWYKCGKWKVVSKNSEEPATDLETQKEHRVALVVQNNTISAYVDGKSLGGPLPISAYGEKPFNPKNVYIAGYDRGRGIKMTVTNVLLYNRVLNGTELEAASERVPSTKKKDFKKITVTSTGSEKKIETTGPVPESTNKAKPVPEPTNMARGAPERTNTGEMPRGSEDSSVCVRLSFTLLFLLGCFCLVIF